jgi:hypothetical protein
MLRIDAVGDVASVTDMHAGWDIPVGVYPSNSVSAPNTSPSEHAVAVRSNNRPKPATVALDSAVPKLDPVITD